MTAGRRTVFLMALAAAAFLSAGPAAGKSAPPLRVIWSSGPVVYVASPDSSALEEGDRVTFSDRGHELGAGTVRRVDPGALALIALDRGALADPRRWKRVRVTNQRIPPRTLPRLRIGYPSRENAFAVCAPIAGRTEVADARYRSAGAQDGAAVLVRVAPASSAPGWPDTLLMRGFAESSDEEIALERGELDATIFWPGELSTRIRGPSPDWDYTGGIRSSGVIVVIARFLSPDGSAAMPSRTDLHALNREWFRGDLRQPGARFFIEESPPGPLAKDRPRLEVPASWHTRGMDTWWNEAGISPGSATSPPVALDLIDVPAGDSDSLLLAIAAQVRGSAFGAPRVVRADSIASAIRSRAAGAAAMSGAERDSLLSALGAGMAFTIRCPVVARPEFRHELRAMGPDAIVNLFSCPAARKTP